MQLQLRKVTAFKISFLCWNGHIRCHVVAPFPFLQVRTDDGATQRNRKMFGLLRSTLQQAREATSNNNGSAQQQKLEKVEQKLKSDRE
jgi:hypothetical protein